MDMIELVKTSANFAEFIKFTYKAKQKKNPRYSVRAFAKKLEVSPAFLQKIINGDKSPSEKFIRNTFIILGLDEVFLDAFIQLGDKKNLKDLAIIENEDVNLISSMEIIVISLINLDESPSTKPWLLSMLSGQENAVNGALDRLMGKGLVEEADGLLTVQAKRTFRIPYEEYDGKEGPVLASIRKDMSTVLPEDRVEYMFVRGNNTDIPYIQKFLSSQLSDLGGTLDESDKPKDQLYQIACFIRPILSK